MQPIAGHPIVAGLPLLWWGLFLVFDACCATNANAFARSVPPPPTTSGLAALRDLKISCENLPPESVTCSGNEPVLITAVSSEPPAASSPNQSVVVAGRRRAELRKWLDSFRLDRMEQAEKGLELAGKRFWSDKVESAFERAAGNGCESCGHQVISYLGEAPFGSQKLLEVVAAAEQANRMPFVEICTYEGGKVFATAVGEVQAAAQGWNDQALAEYLSVEGAAELRRLWPLCPRDVR